MELREYIKAIGDANAAALFGVKERTVASWRLGERCPRPNMAIKIISLCQGLIDWEGIYRDQRGEAA